MIAHPFDDGGAVLIERSLDATAEALGGDVAVGAKVANIDELPPAKIILCDLSPKPLLQIAGHRFPLAFRRSLERYRYGMGVFKVDGALAEAIPWKNEQCRRAGTLHLGGTMEEIAASEHNAWEGRRVERPFVLLSQPSVFDRSRAPSGRHVAWAYCHVPAASTINMLDRIEQQIERFAPGFHDCILGRSVMTPADIEAHNANLVGGDIAGGVVDLWQYFTRPTWRNYSTPVKGLYICSASTPPGVGVHGMWGYYAAALALKQMAGVRVSLRTRDVRSDSRRSFVA